MDIRKIAITAIALFLGGWLCLNLVSQAYLGAQIATSVVKTANITLRLYQHTSPLITQSLAGRPITNKETQEAFILLGNLSQQLDHISQILENPKLQQIAQTLHQSTNLTQLQSSMYQANSHIIDLLTKQDTFMEMLGYDASQHVIILLQNNMELWPTGGYLGSYADFWLDQGAIKDLKIEAIDVPNGQIKGYVEAPQPISQYTHAGGTPGWRLRESNWNSDYPDDEDESYFRVKHNPPFHKRAEITAALTELVSWTKQAQDQPVVVHAGGFHHQFLYIHPFEDGNGRVCRILTALIFIQRGYQINKYFVLDDYYDIDRLEYSDKLHSADNGEMTEWLEYFSQGVLYSLQSALIKVQNLVKTVPVKNRPTKKEEEVLEMMQTRREIVSAEVAEEMNVSRQQAHNLLSSLVEKGFLEKEGSTKASFYTLKQKV